MKSGHHVNLYTTSDWILSKLYSALCIFKNKLHDKMSGWIHFNVEYIANTHSILSIGVHFHQLQLIVFFMFFLYYFYCRWKFATKLPLLLMSGLFIWRLHFHHRKVVICFAYLIKLAPKGIFPGLLKVLRSLPSSVQYLSQHSAETVILYL